MDEIFSDLIRYWEKRRLVYNLSLIVVVVATFLVGLPESVNRMSVVLVLQLFLLAVTANVLYCSAYLVDLFIQISEFKRVWKKYRWSLFIVGLAYAVVQAWFISKGIFRLGS